MFFLRDFKIAFNFRNALRAITLTIFFMAISPHLYVKSEFWQNKYPVPVQHNLKIYNNSKSKVTVAYKNYSKDIHIFKGPNKNINFVNFTVPANKHSYSFDIQSKGAKKIYIPPVEDEVFQSIKVNKTEILSKDRLFTAKSPKNKILHFEVTTKQSLKPVNIFKEINYFAFVIYFTGVFVLFLFLLKKFSIQNIKILVKRNKIELFIFIIFLIFYLITNYSIYTNLNQFNWGNSSDSPLILPQIMYGETKRFHPYYFLPLYPIFDLLVIFTKNLFLSIGIIYSFLAAFSVLFLYKAVYIFSRKRTLSAILAIIFGVTWAQIHTSQTFDLYIITGFYLSILLYLSQKEMQTKEYNKTNMFWIILISALTFGVSVSNIVTVFLLILPVFVIKTDKKIFTKSLILLFVFITLFTALKGFTCHNQSWKHLFYGYIKKEVRQWVSIDNVKNFTNFKQQTLQMPVIIQSANRNLNKTIANTFDIFLCLMFTVSLILIRKFSKDKRYTAGYTSVSIALMYNLIANFYWYPCMGLLFSLNHFALWFMILGYSTDVILDSFKNKNLDYLIYSIFLIYFMLILFINLKDGSVYNSRLIKQSPVEYNFLEAIHD